MTILHCRHCGGAIGSESKRVQCVHCGALFPFSCRVCNRNLRTPFPVYEDERYLTVEEINPENGARIEPHPLCQDHFVRKCPDCGVWFHAHESEGFFRCANCAEEQRQKRLAKTAAPEELEPQPEFEAEISERAGLEATMTAAPHLFGGPELRPGLDLNAVVLAGAGGALLALIAWFVVNGFKF